MPQKAMGTTLSCQQGNQQVTIGKLRAISEIRADSEAVDVTTLDAADGCRAYCQGLKDMGEVTLTGFHEKNETGQALLRTLYQSGAVAAFTVTFPDGVKAAFSAFVKSHALGAAEVDAAVGFSAVLRLTGGVSVS